MTALQVWVDGIAFWAPRLPGWDMARPALRGEAPAAELPAKRPAPTVLAPAERRRAPDSVALALEVATRAVEGSGHDPAQLASLFVSAHGDLAVSDYMCATLASGPTLLSPTRFHNSVHNAAAGYWTIATGCRASSSALAAYDCSFANGLLEAASLVAADGEPVLLVGYDVEACGPLATVTRSAGLLAVALVLAPSAGARSTARIGLELTSGATTRPALASAAARLAEGNAMADALPLFEALARAEPTRVALPLAPDLALGTQIAFP